MAVRVSRRKIASYAANQLIANNSSVLNEVAAFLVQANRTRETDLIAHDIESALAHRGVVVVTVTSAQPLTEQARKDVIATMKQHHDGATVHIKEKLDPTLLGGVIIKTPTEEMDASIRSALLKLTTSNMKEM